MRRARLGPPLARALLLTMLVSAGLPAPSAPAQEPALGPRIERALSARGLRGARVGVLVVDAEDGSVMFERSPDRELVPASNMKVLTAIAALSTFGPTFRFTTEVYANAPPDANGEVAWLAVYGGGDPAMTSEDWWRLAADLRRSGLRRVREGILLDDSAFDAVRWHPNWGPVSSRAYHAPVSSITANYGAFAVEFAPGAVGEAVSAALDPPVDYLSLVNGATTGPRRSRASFFIKRRAADAREEVVLQGSLPTGRDPKVQYRSVLDPTRYAGSVLRLQLEANGIEVEGETRLARVPADAELLLPYQGRSMAEIVRGFMKYSNNVVGEGLVKAMGRNAGAPQGSWGSGMVAMRAALANEGVPTEGLTLIDGSGLSYGNRITARALVVALRRAERSFAFGPEFLASLPIAGGDGTLKKRAEKIPGAVRAKTGLLTRVTSLSGYATLGEGRRAVFAVLVNGYKSGADAAMRAVDGVVAALVAGSPPPRTAGPRPTGRETPQTPADYR